LDGQRVIGVDLGGTKVLAGIVDREGNVEHRRERPTPLGSERELLMGLDEAVAELMREDIVAIGFGIPSRIDQRTGEIQGSVNIPLSDLDLRDRMSDRFGVPVAIDNDANAATLAEFVTGAGKDARDMVMLTLGTGCGGGAVIDGKLYRGWAEFGHMVVEYNGRPCQGSCTGLGHLEGYVTGTAATKLAQEEFGPAVDAHRLVRLAEEGEPKAVEILADMGRYLGAGIATLVNIFDPEVVVIGGGFGAAGDFLLVPAREVIRRDSLGDAGAKVQIVRAQLGTAAGLIGAGLVGFESL
jgi:glucokinase